MTRRRLKWRVRCKVGPTHMALHQCLCLKATAQKSYGLHLGPTTAFGFLAFHQEKSSIRNRSRANLTRVRLTRLEIQWLGYGSPHGDKASLTKEMFFRKLVEQNPMCSISPLRLVWHFHFLYLNCCFTQFIIIYFFYNFMVTNISNICIDT